MFRWNLVFRVNPVIKHFYKERGKKKKGYCQRSDFLAFKMCWPFVNFNVMQYITEQRGQAYSEDQSFSLYFREVGWVHCTHSTVYSQYSLITKSSGVHRKKKQIFYQRTWHLPPRLRAARILCPPGTMFLSTIFRMPPTRSAVCS